MDINLQTTADDVEAALFEAETAYYEQRAQIDAEAKRQRKELLAWRLERRKLLRRLLEVVSLPDATEGHKAVEEVQAGPNGKGE